MPTNPNLSQLSQCTERCFKEFVKPGLHICDFATGGGKSYTIAKLVNQFYPEHFDSIIILCIQLKLITGMDSHLKKFRDDSLLKPDDFLIVRNNPDVLDEALKTGPDGVCPLDSLIEEMGGLALKSPGLTKLLDNITALLPAIKARTALPKTERDKNVARSLDDDEHDLRKAIGRFFALYREELEGTRRRNTHWEDQVLAKCPHLSAAFPQVLFKRRKVKIMTVHKAMHGVDTILGCKIDLQSMAEDNKRTLIIFDESDRAAEAMRDVIINRDINEPLSDRKLPKGYDGFQELRHLLEKTNCNPKEYYAEAFRPTIEEAKSKSDECWRGFADVKGLNDIFLDSRESVVSRYCNGVFFSGPSMGIEIFGNQAVRTFVACNDSDDHLTLVHSKDFEDVKRRYSHVFGIKDFISVALHGSNIILSRLARLAYLGLNISRARFEAEVAKLWDSENSNELIGTPTIEREIYSLMKRFGRHQIKVYCDALMAFISSCFGRPRKDTTQISLPSVYTNSMQTLHRGIRHQRQPTQYPAVLPGNPHHTRTDHLRPRIERKSLGGAVLCHGLLQIRGEQSRPHIPVPGPRRQSPHAKCR